MKTLKKFRLRNKKYRRRTRLDRKAIRVYVAQAAELDSMPWPEEKKYFKKSFAIW